MSALVNRCTAAETALRPSPAPVPQPPTGKRRYLQIGAGGTVMDDSSATVAATATGLFLSLAPCVDVACRTSPVKKPRFTITTTANNEANKTNPAPFLPFHASSSYSSESSSSVSTVTTNGSAVTTNNNILASAGRFLPSPPNCLQSLHALPDECLYEILRRLPAKQDRCAASCVSKRWLMLLGSIRAADIAPEEEGHDDVDDTRINRQHHLLPDLNEDPVTAASAPEIARCFEGKDATDARLAAMAIRAGTTLAKLSVRSNYTSCALTDVGLKAVAHCCPSLRALVLWDVPFVGDDGLAEIADGCPLLEKLDLCQCPLVTDRGIAAIAYKCPNLNTLTLESCPSFSDDGLAPVGTHCRRIQSVSITACPLVRDRGVCTLMCSASSSLRRVKLDNLAITDYTLGVVGYYGREVTDLVLSDLKLVGEKGFWVMGTTKGLRSLTSFTAVGCEGLTDLGLQAVVKGCPALKQLCLKRCASLSDNGLKSSAGEAKALETVRLVECNLVTLPGLVAALGKCPNLKALALSRCAMITEPTPATAAPSFLLGDATTTSPAAAPSQLRSLTIRSCPGIQSSGLAMVRSICSNLQHLDLRGLSGVTDAGFLNLVEACQPGLVKANLSGCSGLSDAVVSSLTKIHGATLEVLNLSACARVTDVSLFAVAHNCTALADLDVSGSAVTDSGVAALASAAPAILSLKVLSLARCANVSTRSLAFLANLGRSLKGLSIQNCNLITSAAVTALVEKMWWCDILS